MEHIEAVNEGFVRELPYPDVMSYIGHPDISELITEALSKPKKLRELAQLAGASPLNLKKTLDQTVYQVKKEAHGKVCLGDIDIERPDPGPRGMRYRT